MAGAPQSCADGRSAKPSLWYIAQGLSFAIGHVQQPSHVGKREGTGANAQYVGATGVDALRRMDIDVIRRLG
jgi:hypothetical protein